MHGKFRSISFADMTVALVSILLLLSSCAGSRQSVYGVSKPKEQSRATASFTPPEGCRPDATLAATVGASQTCIQRFSPTHEFIVALSEHRWRTDRPGLRAKPEDAKLAVQEHVAKLLAENDKRSEGTLMVLREGWHKPEARAPGADHCAVVSTYMTDRHVRGYEGEYFTLIANTVVCARADASNNTIPVVQLSVSERFLLVVEQAHEGYSEKSKAALGSLTMK